MENVTKGPDSFSVEIDTEIGGGAAAKRTEDMLEACGENASEAKRKSRGRDVKGLRNSAGATQ